MISEDHRHMNSASLAFSKARMFLRFAVLIMVFAGMTASSYAKWSTSNVYYLVVNTNYGDSDWHALNHTIWRWNPDHTCFSHVRELSVSEFDGTPFGLPDWEGWAFGAGYLPNWPNNVHGAGATVNDYTNSRNVGPVGGYRRFNFQYPYDVTISNQDLGALGPYPTGGSKENSGGPPQCTIEPINLVSGSMIHDETDIAIPSPGIDLIFSRSYSSQFDSTNAPLGQRWSHSYNWTLSFTNSVWSDGAANDTTNWVAEIKTGSGETHQISRTSDTNVYITPRETDWRVCRTNNCYELLLLPTQIRYLFDLTGVLTNIHDYHGNSLTLTYTNAYSSNLLARVQHSNGQSLDFTYQSNLLTKVQSPSTNFYVTFAYNANSELTNATRVLSAGVSSRTYSYDASTNHSLTQIVNPAGHAFEYLYATSAGGQTLSVCTNMVLENDYYHHTVEYHTNDLYLTNFYSKVTYFRGNSNQWYINEYDPESLRFTTVYGPTSTNIIKSYYWDSDFLNLTNLVIEDKTVSPAEKLITRSAFGTNHTLTARSTGYCAEPSNTWTYTWNPTCWTSDSNVAARILASATDPEGHKTEFIDANTNGLISETRLYHATNSFYSTFFAYTSSGLLSCITNANGHWTQFSHDSYGRVNQVTPQLGPSITLSNNSLGFVERLTLPGDSGNRVTTFGVNELGWVTNIFYPNNLSETFAFDTLGNMTNHVDTAGRATRYTYLPTRKLSSVIRVLSASSAVTNSVSYDNQFNTISLKDAKNRPVETYVLDIQDRPVTVTNLEGQTMSVTYGVGDFVKSVTRFDGTIVSNSYNSDGWLSAITYPLSINTFAYLKNGLLSTAANEQGTVSNSWSFANRLSSSVAAGVDGGFTSTVSYTYFAAGQPSNVVSLAGTNTYTLDNADRVSEISSASGSVYLRFQYSYGTNNGLVSQMTCTNTGVFAQYGFDVMDRVTNIVWKNSASNVLAGFAYSYNNASMITNVSLSGFRSQVSSFSYDNLDRLVSERTISASSVTSVVNYSWDEVGNRTTKTNGDTSVSYSYQNGCNRLTGWTATSTNNFADLLLSDVSGQSSELIGTNSALGQLYVSNSVATDVPSVVGSNFSASALSFAPGTNAVVAAIGDAAGNVGYATNTAIMQVITNASYLFNSAGCVTNIGYSGAGFSENIGLTWNSQYQLSSVSTNGVAAERNGFDALGRRVWNWDGTTTNYFVYDGQQIIADVNATGGLVRSYVWGPGIDNLLAMTVHTGAVAQTYYMLSDHLGSVAAVADSGGNIVESYRYDAWGRVLGVYDANNNPLTQSAIGNRYLWQGREYSWRTGLYFFRSRFYSPVEGRWLSNDPIGISGGLNQYAFCSDNPVNFRDPIGWCKTTATTTPYMVAVTIPTNSVQPVLLMPWDDRILKNVGTTNYGKMLSTDSWYSDKLNTAANPIFTGNNRLDQSAGIYSQIPGMSTADWVKITGSTNLEIGQKPTYIIW